MALHRTGCVAALMVALGAQAAGGSKTKPDAPATDPARERARKGAAFYNLGRFKEAVVEFEAAYQALQAPALLFNIAQCYRQLDDLPMAARLYQSFLRTNPAEASRKQAQELLDKVEADLQHRKATVASPPLELSLPASGAPPAAAEPAATAQIAPPVVAHEVPAPPVEHLRWPAIALGGVGVATLGFGVVEGLGSSSSANQLKTLHQQNAVVAPSQDAALRSDANSKQSRARVLYVASAVAFAAAAVVFFVF